MNDTTLGLWICLVAMGLYLSYEVIYIVAYRKSALYASFVLIVNLHSVLAIITLWKLLKGGI